MSSETKTIVNYLQCIACLKKCAQP